MGEGGDAARGQGRGQLGADPGQLGKVVGDRLGLYRVLAEQPMLPHELAERTGTAARYVDEWLRGQAAGGYVEYDPHTGAYSLSPEQAFALTDPDGAVYAPGAFELALGALQSQQKVTQAFRTGAGVGWHEHDDAVFSGCERFFRPGYAANLVASWLPALDDAEARLRAGAKVADIGCGHGASTIIMAKAYPRSKFTGYDYHGPSIEVARATAKKEGVDYRVTFEVASAKTYPGRDFDLVTVFERDTFRVLDATGTVVLAGRFVLDEAAQAVDWIDSIGADAGVVLPARYELTATTFAFAAADAGAARPEHVGPATGVTLRRFVRVSGEA